MEKKTVLVTGIGGNVGQGIIRNIKVSGYSIRIVGTNISDFSAGNHLVDVFYKVPFGYEDSFIPAMQKIIEKEKVNLVIPSTDFESYFLSLNSDLFSCKLAVSGKDATKKYLDKYLSWQLHTAYNIPFANSLLPSVYAGNYSQAIAKPRKGRGSKGIIKNISDTLQIKALKDDEYMIQEMYVGMEVTTAVYVRYGDGKLHGLISMERSLENGATTYCKVLKDFNSDFKEIAEKMISASDIRGSFNIQSIISDEGEIFPFEVNCRISGTNSIRSGFGFRDVQYTIQELLYNKFPEDVNIIGGFAYRFLSDVIYADNSGILNKNNEDNFIVF